jgi:trimeric autotransporter adhesin
MRLRTSSRALAFFAMLAFFALSLSCGGGGMGSKNTTPTLTSIALSPASKSIAKGTGLQLSATGTFSNGSTQNLTSLATWSASPANIVAVNAQGNLTSSAQGTVTVGATYQGVTGNASITVGPATLVSLAVSGSQQSLPLGESEGMTATGTFTDGSTQNVTQSVTWQATPATTAKINTQGQLTGVGQGVAQISAVEQGITGNASVTVAAPALMSIAVGGAASLPVGESQPMTATGTYSDGSTQNLTQTVAWQAGPSATAKITPQGQLTGVSKGMAQVSAALQGMTGNASVSIGSAALMSIAVNAAQSSLPLGETEPLTATGTYSDGSTQNLTNSVTWSSSGASVVSVNAAGTATAAAIGSATISATSGSISGNAGLSVTQAVAVSLAVSPAKSSLMLGSSVQLQAVATFSDGTTQNMTSTATWNSTSPNIVGVSGSGVASGQQVGSTTVVATSASLTGSSNVTVTPLMTVSYFNLKNAQTSGVDGTIQFVNPGTTTAEDLCAMIYVFDSSQEMNECCGCLISDSGLITLSLINDLTANTLTGVRPVSGTIEMIASTPATGGVCNAGSPTPSGIILGWETNVQVGAGAAYNMTETPMAFAQLTSTEQQVLASDCAMMQTLGSGAGACTCGTGD